MDKEIATICQNQGKGTKSSPSVCLMENVEGGFKAVVTLFDKTC